MKRVLDDIRVLDFGRFIACPYCGMLLADMGAQVIRVDRPGGEEDRTISLIGANGNNVAYRKVSQVIHQYGGAAIQQISHKGSQIEGVSDESLYSLNRLSDLEIEQLIE